MYLKVGTTSRVVRGEDGKQWLFPGDDHKLAFGGNKSCRWLFEIEKDCPNLFTPFEMLKPTVVRARLKPPLTVGQRTGC